VRAVIGAMPFPVVDYYFRRLNRPLSIGAGISRPRAPNHLFIKSVAFPEVEHGGC
jgi:hypothetical protein